MGIDVQVVSPAPAQYCDCAEPGFGLEMARHTRGINDRIAEIVATPGGRFVGLGSVPLQDPKLAVRELKRCVKKVEMRGEVNPQLSGAGSMGWQAQCLQRGATPSGPVRSQKEDHRSKRWIHQGISDPCGLPPGTSIRWPCACPN